MRAAVGSVRRQNAKFKMLVRGPTSLSGHLAAEMLFRIQGRISFAYLLPRVKSAKTALASQSAASV